MATPWERIDKLFQAWLQSAGTTADEYNAASLLDRSDLWTRFDKSRQQPNNENPKLEFIYEYIVKKEKEDGTVRLSKPETGKFRKAVANAKIVLDTPTWNKKPTPTDLKNLASGVGRHSWLPGKEGSVENRKSYTRYLNNENNIRLPEGGKLFEGTADSQLLGVDIEAIGIKTSGNIDVVLADSRHQDISATRQNMWAGIELKRDDNTSKAEIERQVILQHLAASYLNEDAGILTLMTDLCDRWHCCWFSSEKRRLMRYEATKTEAHFLIHHMMDESSSDELTPEDFLKRASWNQVVKAVRLGSVPGEDSQEEMEEPGEMDLDGEERGNRSESTLAQSGRTQGASTSGAQNSPGPRRQPPPKQAIEREESRDARY